MNTITYTEAISHAATALAEISDTPALDARLLVGHACNIDQTTVIAHPENKLTLQEATHFDKSLERRSQGEPLAYITGEKEFWSLDFLVNKYVLIPRPETELLVELALNVISKYQFPRILDLGTGCGAIAISIAKHCVNCSIYASEISPRALEIAKINAQKNEADINFIQSDWFANLDNENFDIIVCNPPYVAKVDPQLDDRVTKFEPFDAVISKNDGMYYIEHIIKQAKKYLNASGYLLIEHGHKQKIKVHDHFKLHKYQSVKTFKDLSGHDRVSYGQILSRL